MKTEYYIGLDCGGTRTRGVVADEQMRILARARAGPGNPLSAGMTVAFTCKLKGSDPVLVSFCE